MRTNSQLSKKIWTILPAVSIFLISSAWAAEQANIDLGLSRPDAHYAGALENELLGTVLTTGDLDGDGAMDFVAGGPHGDNPVTGADRTGVVFVVFGPIPASTAGYDLGKIADRPAEEVTWISGMDKEDWLGSAVAVGDLTGDGIDDLAVGAPMANGADNKIDWQGEVLIFKGGASLRSARELKPAESDFIIYGAKEFDRAGIGLTIGDLSGDGIADLAVLAPFGDVELEGATGRLYLFFGGETFSATHGRVISGTESRRIEEIDFGSISSANNNNLAIADINGDTVGDLLIGSPGAERDGLRNDSGIVYTLIGSATLAASRDRIDFSSRESYGALFQHNGKAEQMGQSLAVSRTQPDGTPWIALGAPLGDYGSRGQCGLVFLFKGGPWIDSATNILAVEKADWQVYGDDDAQSIGTSLAFGDLDGDGWDDLLIGAHLAEGPPRDDDARVGRVYVIYASTLRAATEPLDLETDYDLVIYGDTKKDEFGYVVAASPLFAGNNIDDLLVTSWLGDGPPEIDRGGCGEIYLFQDRSVAPIIAADLSGDGLLDYRDVFLKALPENNGLSEGATVLRMESSASLYRFLSSWQNR